MGRQPEIVLVTNIRKAILSEWPTAYVLKIAGGPYQEAGIPDLIACIEGEFFGIEVKKRRPGESDGAVMDRVTERQQSHLTRITESGGFGLVGIDPEQVTEVVSAILDLLGPKS